MATLHSNIPAIVRRMKAGTARLTRQTAQRIADDIKAGMAKPKSGRRTKRGGKVHVASAPGESPATDDGDYADTIKAVQVDDATSAVGTADGRGPALELGGGEVAARPHFGPAFDRAREGFEKGLAEIFE